MPLPRGLIYFAPAHLVNGRYKECGTFGKFDAKLALSGAKATFMQAIKQFLVALDFTEADQNLFRYAEYLANIAEPEAIHFVHVLKSDYAPESMEYLYDQYIEKPLEEQLKDEVKSMASYYFKDKDVQYAVSIPTGQPFEEILRYSQHHDTDLIIVGEKQDRRSSGIIPSKLARQAGCSLLYVPDSRKQALIDNVFVPLDFSSYSDLAMDFAEELNQKAEIKQFYLQHIYQAVPSYNMMKTYEQMRSTIESNAREAFDRYLKKRELTIRDTKIQPLFTLDEKNSPAYHIHEEARKHYCDLIVMGAKGQSNVAAMFVGSCTEKLLKIDKVIPVLILKKKGENRSLLQSLFYAE